MSGEFQQRHLAAHGLGPAAASFGAQAGRHTRRRRQGAWRAVGIAAARRGGAARSGGGGGDRGGAAAQAAAVGGGQVAGGVAAQQPRGSRQDARLVVVRRQQAQQRALRPQPAFANTANCLAQCRCRPAFACYSKLLGAVPLEMWPSVWM
jgi:hypothetical protein